MGKHSLAVMSSSESVEWYTPAHIIDLARSVLGRIDLDPASCTTAFAVVQADRFYTREQDGLLQPWAGRVWMNPPFGVAIDPWIHRLDHDYRTGAIGAAIALVPARVDTAWWRRLRDYPVCFVTGRIRYSNAENSAPFPTALFYLGPDEARFIEVFGPLGDIYRRVDGGTQASKQLLLGLGAM